MVVQLAIIFISKDGSIFHIILFMSEKNKLLILSRLSESDFRTYSELFNIQSERFISQLWNTVER